LDDKAYVKDVLKKGNEMIEKANNIEKEILDIVETKL
jgi:hypothetical protein